MKIIQGRMDDAGMNSSIFMNEMCRRREGKSNSV